MNTGVKFYDSKDKQIHNVRTCCNLRDNIAIHPKSHLLPFVFTKTRTGAIVDNFEAVYECDGVEQFRITLPTSLIEYKATAKLDYYIARFTDLLDPSINTELSCHACDGKKTEVYFLIDLNDGSSYYSEVFHVQDVPFSEGSNVVFGSDFSSLDCWSGTWEAPFGVGLGYCHQVANGIGGSLTQDIKLGLYQIDITGDVYTNLDRWKLNGKPIEMPFSGIVLTDKINITFDAANGEVGCLSSVDAKPITSECYSFIASGNECDKRDIPYSDYFDLWILDGQLFEPSYPRTDNTNTLPTGIEETTKTLIQKQWNYTLNNQVYEPLVDELVTAQANDWFYLWDCSWKRALCDGELIVTPTFVFNDKCDAQIDIQILETLADDTACCDELIFDCLDCPIDVGNVDISYNGDIIVSSQEICFDSYEISYGLQGNPFPPATTVSKSEMMAGFLIENPQIPLGETLSIQVVAIKAGCDNLVKIFNRQY